MRVSIWQQFSSNHSASFTVVGHFNSVQKAEDAERTLKTLFENIRLYWAGVSRADERPPSWAEVEASQTYDIEWDKSVDWLVESLDKHLLRFEQYIFVTTAVANTGQCSDTMEAIMNKLANSVYVKRMECREETLVLIEVICTAPSELTASTIAAEIEGYLSSPTRQSSIPPWEIFSPTLKLSAYDLLRRPYDSEPDITVVAQAVNALYHYQKAANDKHQATLAEAVAIAALTSLRDQDYTFLVSLDSDTLSQIAREVAYLADTLAFGGKIETEGHIIHLPEVAFFRPECGIPALVEYLKSRNCTNIIYTLKTVPYASKPEYI